MFFFRSHMRQTLADFPYVIVRVDCTLRGRTAHYRLARLGASLARTPAWTKSLKCWPAIATTAGGCVIRSAPAAGRASRTSPVQISRRQMCRRRSGSGSFQAENSSSRGFNAGGRRRLRSRRAWRTLFAVPTSDPCRATQRKEISARRSTGRSGRSSRHQRRFSR